MVLTDEQKSIIESKGDIKINAVAGSGKTATVIEYAKARPSESKILYLAFNRSVKLEAEKKFSDKGLNNVRVETAHSLAFDHIIRRGRNKYKQLGSYKTYQIKELLNLKTDKQHQTDLIIANHINKFSSYFCNSNSKKVSELDYTTVVSDPAAKEFVSKHYEEILQNTRQFLAKMENGEIDITHDFYLKKFQLASPSLGYDYILFDEGQDASPAMLDVFVKQKATKVIVGDTHQQIYGWRYAVNSLEKVDYASFFLTRSFRFDEEIAFVAKRVLNWKKVFHPELNFNITGAGNSNKLNTRAFIARTNLSLIVKAIELLFDKKEISSIYFEGNINSYTYADEGASIYDVYNLYFENYEYIKDSLIKSMKNIAVLEEYIEKTNDKELKIVLDVVKKYGRELPALLKRLKSAHVADEDKNKADMIFSTVHRCKGMEYDEVTLACDFINEHSLNKIIREEGIENVNSGGLSEEVNLLYVAVTRTLNYLNIPRDLMPQSKINILEPEPEMRQKKRHSVKSFWSEYEKTKTETEKSYRLQSWGAYQSWNEQLDDELEILFCKGKSLNELAEHFGRTKNAIKKRINKLELYDKYR